jgi:hypothetical protein
MGSDRLLTIIRDHGGNSSKEEVKGMFVINGSGVKSVNKKGTFIKEEAFIDMLDGAFS